MKLNLLTIVLLLNLNQVTLAQKLDWQQYVCYQANQAISIDGKLAEEDWNKAPWTSDFVDIEGDKKPKPRYKTRVKMLWDSSYFYIAAALEEPHIWATYTKRDAVIYHENDFEFFIDPDGDTHHYYELEINALGTIWDLMLVKPYRDGGPALNAWDIRGLKKGISINGTLNDPSDIDKSWTIELAIPWNVLKEANQGSKIPEDGDQWRVNFSRVNWEIENKDGKYVKSVDPSTGKTYPEFNWTWSPQGVIAMHEPEHWGLVQFTNAKVGSKSINFIPNREEDIKWVLRELYYAMHNYKLENYRYINEFDRLNVPQFVKDKKSKISIYASPRHFTITYNDKSAIWHISHEGKTWKIK